MGADVALVGVKEAVHHGDDVAEHEGGAEFGGLDGGLRAEVVDDVVDWLMHFLSFVLNQVDHILSAFRFTSPGLGGHLDVAFPVKHGKNYVRKVF